METCVVSVSTGSGGRAMASQLTKGMERFDQPRRQTMFFRSMPAALEVEPEQRCMRLVFLVDDRDPAREVSQWCIDAKGRLIQHPPQDSQPLTRRGHSHWQFRRARSIANAIERAFTGLKIVSDWSRWLIHKLDGVRIDRPTYIEERGSLELLIRVEPKVNFDQVYDFILHVLEQQPGFESRGTRRSAFTAEVELLIEQMPTDREESAAQPVVSGSTTKGLSETAADVLRMMMQRRNELEKEFIESNV